VTVEYRGDVAGENGRGNGSSRRKQKAKHLALMVSQRSARGRWSISPGIGEA
jgi:hypothetical protein